MAPSGEGHTRCLQPSPYWKLKYWIFHLFCVGGAEMIDKRGSERGCRKRLCPLPLFVSPVSGPGAFAPGSRLPIDRIAMTDSGITIELTSTQVDRVVRNAANAQGISSLLQGLSEKGGAATFKELAESPRLSRSLLLGLLVLASFPADSSPLTVTDVANHLEMSPSTTHRYLTTLLAIGLLEQDPRTRRYRVPITA
jgi:DNA-binding transcriptional ArsR family regulator